MTESVETVPDKRFSRRRVLTTGGVAARVGAFAAIAGGVAFVQGGTPTPRIAPSACRRFENKMVVITGATLRNRPCGGDSGSRRKVAKSASAGAKRSRCRGRAADPFGGRRSDLHAGGRRDEADVHNFVDQIAAKYGRLDVCFNNAGITVQNALHEYTSAEWDDVINTICAGSSWR